jgi:hypothetical protein
MKNSNVIISALSASGPSTLSIFFTLETKVMGLLLKKGEKEAEDLRISLIAIV